MGQLGKMLKRLLNKLLKVLKKILNFIKKYWQYFALALVIACIMIPGTLPAIAAFFSAPSWAVTAAVSADKFFVGLPFLWQAAAAGTAAVLIAPDATKNVAGKVVDGVVEVGGKVIDGAADLAGSALGGVSTVVSKSGIFKWLLIGGGVYLGVSLLSNSGGKSKEVRYVQARA